jgi:hypothetical protein
MRVGFEPTILMSEQAKTFHALDRAATVIGRMLTFIYFNLNRCFLQYGIDTVKQLIYKMYMGMTLKGRNMLYK